MADRLTFGERAADIVAAIVGSWPFIILQSCMLAAWIAANTLAWIHHWDAYPFILLNLALSFQAAYTGPIVMISQNRQEQIQKETLNAILTLSKASKMLIEDQREAIDELLEHEREEVKV